MVLPCPHPKDGTCTSGNGFKASHLCLPRATRPKSADVLHSGRENLQMSRHRFKTKQCMNNTCVMRPWNSLSTARRVQKTWVVQVSTQCQSCAQKLWRSFPKPGLSKPTIGTTSLRCGPILPWGWLPLTDVYGLTLLTQMPGAKRSACWWPTQFTHLHELRSQILKRRSLVAFMRLVGKCGAIADRRSILRWPRSLSRLSKILWLLAFCLHFSRAWQAWFKERASKSVLSVANTNDCQWPKKISNHIRSFHIVQNIWLIWSIYTSSKYFYQCQYHLWWLIKSIM